MTADRRPDTNARAIRTPADGTMGDATEVWPALRQQPGHVAPTETPEEAMHSIVDGDSRGKPTEPGCPETHTIRRTDSPPKFWVTCGDSEYERLLGTLVPAFDTRDIDVQHWAETTIDRHQIAWLRCEVERLTDALSQKGASAE